MSKHMDLGIRVAIDPDNPSIVREEELCIKCGMCKKVCEEKIAVHGTYSLENTGDSAICIHCGQCANVCPTGSIHIRNDDSEVQVIGNFDSESLYKKNRQKMLRKSKSAFT